MVKGDPTIGEEVFLSYNTNVSGYYAGIGTVCFHDEDLDSDHAIYEALLRKCGVGDPHSINTDHIFWAPREYYLETTI